MEGTWWVVGEEGWPGEGGEQTMTNEQSNINTIIL